MNQRNKRDDFPDQVKVAVARRASFTCSICEALTVGPSEESPLSTMSVGVAAHITAASPGGPRYDPALSSEARKSVENAIWLCETDARRIDRDTVTWTAVKLSKVKREHETRVSDDVGIPRRQWRSVHTSAQIGSPQGIAIREYASIRVNELDRGYRDFIAPILADRQLAEDSSLGVLMCVSGTAVLGNNDRGTKWTAFVNPKWLEWLIQSQALGLKAAGEVPPEHIYGLIPAWPDEFLEFLLAMVEANATFVWQRRPDGYLALVQEGLA